MFDFQPSLVLDETTPPGKVAVIVGSDLKHVVVLPAERTEEAGT